MEIITDVLTGLRTVDSSLEKEDTEKEEDKQEKSSKKANKVEVATKIAQIVLEVAAGERTPNGFVKDSLFNINNMQNLLSSPIFDTYVKIACGLGPLDGKPLIFSIPFPQFPSESTTVQPSKVQEEVPYVHVSSPPL